MIRDDLDLFLSEWHNDSPVLEDGYAQADHGSQEADGEQRPPDL
jgi:hypothetical protein